LGLAQTEKKQEKTALSSQISAGTLEEVSNVAVIRYKKNRWNQQSFCSIKYSKNRIKCVHAIVRSYHVVTHESSSIKTASTSRSRGFDTCTEISEGEVCFTSVSTLDVW